MTVHEAISGIDGLWPNQYTDAQKLGWLNALDGMIFLELLCTHEGGPERFTPYTSASAGTELLVPPPYDGELYMNYLQSCIDRHNGETGRYNVSASLYNAAMQRFEDYWNRTHRPMRRGKVRL